MKNPMLEPDSFLVEDLPFKIQSIVDEEITPERIEKSRDKLFRITSRVNSFDPSKLDAELRRKGFSRYNLPPGEVSSETIDYILELGAIAGRSFFLHINLGHREKHDGFARLTSTPVSTRTISGLSHVDGVYPESNVAAFYQNYGSRFLHRQIHFAIPMTLDDVLCIFYRDLSEVVKSCNHHCSCAEKINQKISASNLLPRFDLPFKICVIKTGKKNYYAPYDSLDITCSGFRFFDLVLGDITLSKSTKFSHSPLEVKSWQDLSKYYSLWEFFPVEVDGYCWEYNDFITRNLLIEDDCQRTVVNFGRPVQEIIDYYLTLRDKE